MNSQINIKGAAPRLALISAALLLHSNAPLAAEFAADPQSQARDLVSGTVGGRSTTTDTSICGSVRFPTPFQGRHARRYARIK
jgi:hypothetical protein